MCATVLAPQIAMTTPFEAASRYQGSNFRRVENAGDREQPLGRKWVVVIDEHGNRKLQICWTVARVVPPARFESGATRLLRYGFRALPVTDENGIILGVVPCRGVMNLKHRILD